MTKEELIAENAKLEVLNKQWADSDLQRRQEFAKAFNLTEMKGMYNSDREYRKPTWPEIFVEIGKLLAVRDFRDFEGNLSEMECKIKDILTEIKNPKL